MARFQPLLLALLAGTLAAFPACGGTEAYLQVEGVSGEGGTPGHEGWIEVLQVTNALARVPGSETPGMATAGAFGVLKQVDKASPLLMLACAAGTVIPSARLELVTTNGNTIRFFQLELSNVVVRAVHNVGAAHGPEVRPLEQCDFSFQQIRWRYTELRPRSRLPLGYHDSWWNWLSETGDSSSLPARFEVTGIHQGPKHVVLSWRAEAGKTYAVYSSSHVEGPFSLLGRVSAAGDTVVNYPVPLLAPALFFAVEQQP